MTDPVLSQRESYILKSLVVNFVDWAVPIGSRFLSSASKNRLSSATIRNVMMDLEEKGLVTQPHTSSGRIPTDLGYRYYVNDLMMIEKLSKNEKDQIASDLRNVLNEDVEAILEKACEALAKISNQLGIAISPRFYQGKFEKLELVSLSENRLLVIITITSGLIKTVTMEIKSSIQKDKLEDTARILNERLSGLTLRQIRDSFTKRMAEVSSGDEELLLQFSESVDRIFSIENDHILFRGTQNILSQPEFSTQKRIGKILQLLDDQRILIRVINNSTKEDEKISITIGQENEEELINNCSLITTCYKIGDVTGTLGILGPTRMKYEKVTSMVDYIAKEISNLFMQQNTIL